MNLSGIKLIECPRDAMQGWHSIISTQNKIEYLSLLLQVGFDTLDFGSFVSPKAIPQMADTAEVVDALNMANTTTKLLAIVANLKGAQMAADYEKISFLGFPFSISPTFQKLNTNSTIETSFDTVKEILNICTKHNKKLVVYLSMGFGNPYGDEFNSEIVQHWVEKLTNEGVEIISLADTVGLAESGQVFATVSETIKNFSKVEIGVHLHSTAKQRKEKVQAALDAGCTRFDGALKGIGGCPMANNELVGNMDTLRMLNYFSEQNIQLSHQINDKALSNALIKAEEIFV